jgi:cytochrome c peroxidase
MYTRCDDVNGCPLATAVFHQLMTRLKAEPAVASAVQLVTFSFDPQHDTPELMREQREMHTNGTTFDWHFVTTASTAVLAPMLDAYDQTVLRHKDEAGNSTGAYSHILRVFLIDTERRVRNIYSVAFLHAETLANDVLTLLSQNDRAVTVPDNDASTHGSGDVKTGSGSDSNTTWTQDLMARSGQPANLLDLAHEPSLGLPRLSVPLGSELTAERIELGRKLFFDRRLSLNNTFSCAMCHIPEQGYTSNELATAVGVEGRTVRRNAPTLFNVAYVKRLFHDAREFSLEQQVWSPLLASNEMANPSIGYVVEKLQGLEDYTGLFERAFDGRRPDMQTIGIALASYQRVLISANAPFDRANFGSQREAMSASQWRGLELFRGKAGCTSCHLIGNESALFSDDRLHNTGIGYRGTMMPTPAWRTIQIAPGVQVEVETASYAASAERPPSDLGRYEVTQDPADRWRYRTPGLRNVALSAPYMHDGSLATLAQVVKFYDQGGVPNPTLDPLIRPLNLTSQERGDLVAFLAALTGDRTATLVRDAFAAPVGDTRARTSSSALITTR